MFVSILFMYFRPKAGLPEKLFKLCFPFGKGIPPRKNQDCHIETGCQILPAKTVCLPAQPAGVVPRNSVSISTRKSKYYPVLIASVGKDKKFDPVPVIFSSFSKYCLNGGRTPDAVRGGKY
jgi:hypothetical protein